MTHKFRIASHYWKEGKNATWAVSSSFDRDVLAWLKNQYSMLEEGRPSFKVFDHKSLFFFYTDTQDVYGRKITEILAVLVDVSFTSPDHIKKLISDHLLNLSPSDLEFNLSIENAYVIDTHTVSYDKSKRQPKPGYFKALVVSSSILVLLIAVWFVIFDDKQNTQETTSNQPATQINDLREKSRKDNIAKTVPGPISHTNSIKNNFCEKYSKAQNQIDSYCFGIYIENQCGNNTDRKSYKKWFQNNQSIAECEFVNEPDKDMDLKNWIEENTENKKLIRNFFDGKE